MEILWVRQTNRRLHIFNNKMKASYTNLDNWTNTQGFGGVGKVINKMTIYFLNKTENKIKLDEYWFDNFRTL